MKHRKQLLLFLVFFLLLVNGNTKESNTLRVGLAKVNVTPQIPTPLRGYSERTEPFKGVHDSLYARTLVFSNENKRAVLISVDIVEFLHSFYKEFTDELYTETGIPAKYVLLAATHTHGGPDARVELQDQYKPQVAAFKKYLKQQLIKSVKQALENLQPAQMGAGTGECKLNINRRAPHPDGGIWLGMNPNGTCDHTVGVVRIDDEQNEPMALFVNWPCHGTIKRGNNYLITGDWPGAAAQYIEKKNDKINLSLVTAGASGDINPIYRPKTDSFDTVELTGATVGQEAMDVAKTIKTFSTPDIQAEQREIWLPGKKIGTSRFPRDNKEPADDLLIRLSALKVGNIVFTGVSGEVMTEIGLKLKEKSPYNFTFMITHCNGKSFYLVTDKAYEVGGYEVLKTKAMSGAEDAIVGNLLEMIYAFD